MTVRIGPAALVLLALPWIAGCPSPGSQEQIEFRVPVFAREVETGTVEDRIVGTGSLRARETVVLSPETGGKLVLGRNSRGRRLAEGDRVEAGQTIAEITGEEVRLAARSDATWQRYQSAQREYDSKKALFDQGLISEVEFRPVVDALAEAKIDWERSQFTESRSRLVTPISGVILRLARDDSGLPLAEGQLVAQGFVVAQIAPTVSLIADVDVVGPDVARVRPGLEARVRHHAWDDRTFDGHVLRLAPSLDPVTRALRTEVEVDNRAGLLRPGMFVEVTMVAERREDVPVVLRDAVAVRGGRKVVFVVKGQKVERRDVVLGLGDDKIIEVRDGLEAGERVVVRGLETLIDQQRVIVSGS